MSLFAIADLHLPGNSAKPMEVFGSQWDHHFEKIAGDWISRVQENDTVLISGDISWAMYLQDAEADLRSIGDLPGNKVICKGNHDFWWNSLSQVKAALPENVYAVQNTAVKIGEFVVCGTRGWVVPDKWDAEDDDTAGNEKIYRREVGRLELALQAAEKIRINEPLVVMMHYPPMYSDGEETGFSQLLEKYGASCAVYGHLHGQGVYAGFNQIHNGVRYFLTSCDSIGFKLKKIEL